MSAWNLHRENLALRGQITQLLTRIRRLEQIPRCGYCGCLARAGHRTCTAHADLPESA